jgi:hypothetical protein
MRPREQRDEAARRYEQTNPVPPGSYEDWGRTEEGEALLAAIVSSSPPAPPRRRRMGLRPVAVGFGLALTALVVWVGVAHYHPSNGPSSTLAGAATTATTVAAGTPPTSMARPPSEYEMGHVRVSIGLPELVYALGSADVAHPMSFEDASKPETAVTFGLLSPDEAATLDPESYVTRGQYALWLWRAYRTYLQQGDTPAQPASGLTDLPLLSPEVREAVQGLASYGIIRGAPGGAYGASEDLTHDQKRTLLDRLEELLPLRVLPRDGGVWVLELAGEWVGQRLRDEADRQGLGVRSFSMEEAGPYREGSTAVTYMPRGFRLVKLTLTSPEGEAAAKAFVAQLAPLIYGFNHEQYTQIGVYQVEVFDADGRRLFGYQNDLENRVESWD